MDKTKKELASAERRNFLKLAGSGAFTVVTPWLFEIEGNPLIRGEVSDIPICDWHAAVFERLYQELVHRDVQCRETHCAAQAPGQPCRFELTM